MFYLEDLFSLKGKTAIITGAGSGLGQIDILVNCAGILIIKPALENTEQDWDRVFNVNIKGTWLMCQTVAKQVVAQGIKGSIINISSADSHRAQKDMTPYSATKAAVNHLTRSLGYELAPHGIRVNAIAPSGMLTDMVKNS